METLHPATKLLILLCLLLTVGVPALAWWTVARRHADQAARWWYAGLAMNGAGALVVAWLQRASGYTAICLVACTLMCLVSARLESQRPLTRAYTLVVGFAAFAAVAIALDVLGHWLSFGVLFCTSSMVLLYAWLLPLLFHMKDLHQSRGMWVVVWDMLVAAGVNMVHSSHVLWSGVSDYLFA